MHRRQATSRASPAPTRHRFLPRRAPGGSSGLPTLHLPCRPWPRRRSPPASHRTTLPQGFWPLWDRPPSRQDPPCPPLPHRRRRTFRLLQRCRSSRRDPVETAGALRPAALTPADQVQVLELVTQMAAIVRDLRAQQTQLRADFGKTAADNGGASCGFRAPVGACRSPSRALGGADCRRAARFVAPGLSLGASKRGARGPRFKCGADD